MSTPLFDISQYQSETQRSYSADWRDAIAPDPSWDDPDLEPNSEFSIQQPDNDVPTAWRSAAFFTITLGSGQIINVKFVPGVEGELAMHQFDFTGPVSSTGFKSHFVLAVKSEQFPHPCDYAQEVAAQFVEKQHMPPNKKRSRSHKQLSAPQELLSEQDNFTFEHAMAENKTNDHPTVEVVEELSPEDAADKHRLELRVERAFYESGLALRELRDRRLYRSTHKSFEQYCQDRFGFQRRYPYYLIDAVTIVDNLCTNSAQILPNKETQVRPLTKLEPDEQCLIWQEAVEQAGGKVPPARIVKDAVLRHLGIVERLKEKNPPPPELALGDVVEIRASKHSPLRQFNGMWGIIEYVGSYSYTVRISIARDTQQCKEEEMTRINDEYIADIKAVGKRIQRLVELDLEPVDFWVLEGLQRSICFTPRQLLYLERIESDYGLRTECR